ncbi:MAG: heparinase II/III family protein [Armatimonadota bacterium]
MYNHSLFVAICLFLLMVTISASGDSFAQDAGNLPGNPLKSHPRIILTQSDIHVIRKTVKQNPIAAGYLESLSKHGDAILDAKPVERILNGPRLLYVSRAVLDRVTTLGLLYRLDNDPKWAARAIKEMRAAAVFVDWNSPHFLDVAEMTAAMAFGYDWLYDAMTPEDRALIRTAIVKKGLDPALALYRTNEWWTKSPFNWNNVCNGGMILGALAVADEEPSLAKKIISYALKSLPLAMATYAPDGAWPEGTNYWEYATHYTLFAAYALRSALGTDMGVMEYPGMRKTGYYPQILTGSTGKEFDFADSATGINMRTCLYGLARWYADPAYAYLARKAPKAGDISAFDLIWFDPSGSEQDIASTPLDTLYSNVGVATFRSSWTDPNAIFVGFKAGSNSANHAHLDLGSFVLDADGVRWADDLGSDSYNLPYYFVPVKRWSYYRLSTPGHNTITFDGANQDLNATAPITKYVSVKDHAFAIADLTSAYTQNGAKQVIRGIALRDKRRQVLVQDEIEVQESANIVWSIHTSAVVNIDPAGTHATLTLAGKTMHVYLLSPAGTHFIVEEVKLNRPYRPLTNERKLLIRMPEKTAKTRVVVIFSPHSKMDKLPELTALDAWK